MSTDLTHYGVKGMRWGVRRSEAQLARARGSQEKAEKFLAKRDAKDKKWAEKKIAKGKGERTVARRSGWSEQAQSGMKRIDERAKLLAAKELDKNPGTKRLSPQQKAYFRDKAAKQILVRNVAEKQIKTKAVDVAVKEALKRGGQDKLLDLTNQNEMLVRVGVWAAQSIVTSKITNANSRAIMETGQAALTQRRNRRLDVLESELEKRR